MTLRDEVLFNENYAERLAPYGTPPRTTVLIAALRLPSAGIELSAIAHVRTPSPGPAATP